MASRIRARLLRARLAGDAGFSLMELMVALVIFSVFIGIVISSIVALSNASTKAQVTARTTSAELAVFERLDRQIRYADSINFPGAGSSTDKYVEFRTPASSSSNGSTTCTQWRYDPAAGTISSRKWTDTTGATLGAWELDMSNVYNDGGSSYPFRLTPAVGTSMQQLTLTLDAGNVAIKGTAIQSVFVARNSSIASPSNSNSVVAGTSDTPICPGATRP